MVAVIALIILAIAVITGIFAMLVVLKRKRERKLQADYQTSFILGIIWIPFSVVLMIISFIFQMPFYIGLPLFILGLVYLIIGLANRDKWKKTLLKVAAEGFEPSREGQ